jgi:hypothetical protein
MMRTTMSTALVLASVSIAGVAGAQATDTLGGQGQFIVSGERLFGLSLWWLKSKPDPTPGTPNPATTTWNGTDIHLLWGADIDLTDGGPSGTNADFYSIPRIGFDYVAIPSLTLGGSVGYFHQSSSRERTSNGTTVSRDLPTGWGFLVSPRVGYIIGLSPLLAIWPRGGVTYFYAKSSSTNDSGTTTTKVSLNGFAVSLDPQLVISPVPHFGFTVGPVADIPLAGNVRTESTNTNTSTTTSTDTSTKITNLGLVVGMLGYF